MKRLVFPSAVAGVDDDEVARFGGAAVHVGGGLLEAVVNSLLQAAAQDFEFDDELALAVVLRPQNDQVGAPAPQAVLALDAAAAVDDALQERLQEQLRPRFLEGEAARPVLGVFAEEGLEGGEQLDEVQTTVGANLPRPLLDQALLGRDSQLARHHLGVDGIGDAEWWIAGDEPQVANVLDVTGGEIAFLATAQQRRDDAPHPILLKLCPPTGRDASRDAG